MANPVTMDDDWGYPQCRKPPFGVQAVRILPGWSSNNPFGDVPSPMQTSGEHGESHGRQSQRQEAVGQNLQTSHVAYAGKPWDDCTL